MNGGLPIIEALAGSHLTGKSQSKLTRETSYIKSSGFKGGPALLNKMEE